LTAEESVFERLRKCRVVPVIKLPNAECASGLGEALVEGGLPCAEITFRSDAAEAGIVALAKIEGMLVGAGTVRSPEQVDRAHGAGAKFVVSPGLRQDVVERALELGVAVSPGVCTPSEVERALDLGVRVLKFFPAEAFGGLRTLQALAAVYPDVPFVPTGGINEDTLARYLALPNVLACGGSWLADAESLARGRFDEIAERVRRAVDLSGRRAE
jgi:2-dehydro-3-deoxyphosphogluconate aldolase/(4S)-4-hydroxy-2-oxoglutarate aldolase